MKAEPYSEEKWQRESDARTLAEAKQIMTDKKRYTGAKKAAVALAEKAEAEANSMKSVAKKQKTKKSPAPKRKSTKMTMAAMRKKLR